MDQKIVDVVRSRYGSVAKSDLSAASMRAFVRSPRRSATPRSNWPPFPPRPTWACLAAIPRPLPA